METDKSSNLLELSLKNETKDKFDALLKAAINKKAKSVSQENLLSSNENLSEIDENNYILNKFLNNSKESEEFISVDLQNDNVTFIKPPVPKPRKKLVRSDSQSSQRTYEVTSPKVLNSPKDVKSPDSSNKTYTLEDVGKEIGDVLIHNSSSKTIVVISQNNSPVVEKGEVESLSDDDTKFSFDDVKTDKKTESIELKEIRDSIEYVNETKPKPKLRVKKSGKKEEVEKKYKYDKILEIIVHKTDKLKLTSFVVHPVVKIHIVNIENGNYLKKSDKNRPVVFFYENRNYVYISPIITYNYNLQEKRSLFPCWEEKIILNEDYSYIKDNMENIIIFFEILDFVSFSVVAANVPQIQKGWYKIAFAFLKIGSKTYSNLEKKLRLQLYYPQNLKSGPDSEKCELWDWWMKNKKLRKYPSTLYVTLKYVIPPGKIIEVLRSKTSIEREGSKLQLNDELKDFSHNQMLMSGDSKDLPVSNQSSDEKFWTKVSHETCKLPNKLMAKFNSFQEGCFVLKFSNSGLLLACAVKTDDMYSIIVYSIRTLKEVNIFPCHQGLIYSIRWSKDDSLLISASSDKTVSIWNCKTSIFLQILPHSSFVYCAEISNNGEIASGDYDKIIRIWEKIDNKYSLRQKLEGHKGFVTSLCFNKKSTLLFSSDSVGLIIEWNKNEAKWEKNREIILMDIHKTIINQILLFPTEKRILIHSRDSIMRIVDLKTSCILHWLKGGLNRKIQTFCSISSCGNFVICGSENGLVNVWNTRNGNCCTVYEPFTNCCTINCVEFHPIDNILALSHYGDCLPILLYNYDINEKDNGIKMRILQDNEVKSKKSDDNFNVITNRLKHKEIENTTKDNVNFETVLQKMDEVIESEMKKNKVAES